MIHHLIYSTFLLNENPEKLSLLHIIEIIPAKILLIFHKAKHYQIPRLGIKCEPTDLTIISCDFSL